MFIWIIEVKQMTSVVWLYIQINLDYQCVAHKKPVTNTWKSILYVPQLTKKMENKDTHLLTYTHFTYN